MSTKIYNGYAHPSPDLSFVFQDFHEKRRRVAEIGNGIMARTYAKIAVDKIDTAALKGESCESPLVGVMSQVLDRQAEVRAKSRRDRDVDLESSVVLFPFADKTLVMVWTEHDEIREVLTEGLVKMPWWDNTDKPDDVSEADWEARGEMWESVLSRDPMSRPGACGLTIDFLPDTPVPRVKRMMLHLPTTQSRVRRILLGEICAALVNDDVPLWTAAARCSSPEFLEAKLWKSRAEEIKAVLPEITQDVLRNGFHPASPASIPEP